MINQKKVCNHCVMDTTDKNITFDENGMCNRCSDFNNHILKDWNYGRGHEEELKNIIEKVKLQGKGNDYDCIIGLSGGLYKIVRF